MILVQSLRFSLAVFAGLLIALGQAPYNNLIAIVGIFFLVYFLIEDRPSSKYLFTTTWVVYALGVCYWLSYFGLIALVLFAFAQTLFALALYFIYRKIRNEKYDFLIVPLLWVAFEFILANIPIFSFSWLSISTIFIDTDLIFVSRLGGSALVVFFVLLVTYLFASIYKKIFNSAHNINYDLVKKYTYMLIMVIGCILIAIGVSEATVAVSTKKISIASLQGNDLNRELTSQEIQDRYLENSHIALAKNLDRKYDLVVFPESAFSRDPNVETELFEKLTIPSSYANKAVILNTIATEGDKTFNRNYFYNPSMELMGFYDKKRLVPFGEYIPFGSLIGQWPIFDPIGEGFNHGKTNVVIDNIASVICYESTFSSDVRAAIGNNAKLLVVTTNNRSYRESGNSEQHLNQSRLRAIEYGISVVHSSISGPSALIENNGDIVSKSSMFERAVVTGELSFSEPNSLFARIGDWLSLVALIVVGWLLLIKQRIFNGKIKHR